MSDDYLEEVDENCERATAVLRICVPKRFPIGTLVRIPRHYGAGDSGVVDDYCDRDPRQVVVKVSGAKGDEPRYPFVLFRELLRLNPR